MTFDRFKIAFGAPRPGTGVRPADLELKLSDALNQFAIDVGGGVFVDGLASVLSVREQVGSLGGWEHWLPEGARLFGCSAFGLLMATRGQDVWIVDTQYGQVIESDFSIEEFLNELATDEGHNEDLHAELFQQWNRMIGPLDARSVLCPTPALALGGTMSVETLNAMTLPVYLSFTGQMFAPNSGMPAEVRRLG